MHTVTVTLTLLELRGKYAEMLSMRLEHAAGGEDEVAVRARMAELASRYPGALRELDDLTLDEIRARVHALDAAIGDSDETQPWMHAMLRFHALARGALCAKRWLAGRKRIDAAIERAFSHASATFAFPDDALVWLPHLARIASPPRGRVTDAVFARLAEELGTSDRAARRLVFGAPRRERRSM
jgi:hypothetical protein